MLKGETFPLHWSLSDGFSAVGDPPSIAPFKIFCFYVILTDFNDAFCDSCTFAVWEVISFALSVPEALPHHSHFIFS